MKRIFLVFLFASFNAWADGYSVLSINDAHGWYFTDGVSQGQTSLKTIIDKDGHKTITDGDNWMANARNYSAPLARNYSAPLAHQANSLRGKYQQPQQVASQTPLEHARELMETSGLGGLVEARVYMDMVDATVSERNCTPGNEQPKFRLQQADINAAQAYVKELMKTGGIGGGVVARKYTDMLNGLIAAQNCSLGDYQQQREIRNLKNQVRQLNSQ